MSSCNLDHSLEDVKKKLESQQGFLPQDLYTGIVNYLSVEREQEILNEVFHLLKKYDLSSGEEQMERNEKLMKIIN